MRVYSNGKVLCCHCVKLVIRRSKCLTSIGYKYGHRFSVTILIFRIEFAIKLVLEEYLMEKSYLNLGFYFGSCFVVC